MPAIMRWPDVWTWGSTAEERRAAFACDRHLPVHDQVLFRAVSVAAPGATLFRWLCQLRAAPYSYDWIDNFGRRSPREVTPGLDELHIGQTVMSIFELVEFERDRHLTLRTAPSRIFGQYAVTYAVIPLDARRCRLVVKLLVALPRLSIISSLVRFAAPAADWIMMRKQLLTLKTLAERDARRS
jgi:hypothetical protein